MFSPRSNMRTLVWFYLVPSGKLLALCYARTSLSQTCGWEQSGPSQRHTHKEQALLQLPDSHVRAMRTHRGLVRAWWRWAAWRWAKETSSAALQEAAHTAGDLSSIVWGVCQLAGSWWVIWLLVKTQNVRRPVNTLLLRWDAIVYFTGWYCNSVHCWTSIDWEGELNLCLPSGNFCR